MMEPQDSAKARSEIVSAVILLVATLAVLVLAANGSFLSMMSFPLIFGIIVSAVAVASLFRKRQVAPKIRGLLTCAIVVVALLAPLAHFRYVHAKLRANEERGMAALGDRAAPAIAFSQSFRMQETSAGTLAFGERATLVNFWASWCGTCVSEMPVLEELWRGGAVDVVGVTRLYDDPENAEEELRSLGELLTELNLSYPVLVEGEDAPAHREYRVSSLPTSVLIDARGRVVAYGAGRDGTERLIAAARDLMAAD